MLAALCLLLATACGFDYYKRKIPNEIIIIMIVVGIIIGFRAEGVTGIPLFIGRTASGMALLYPFFKLGAIGAGDVKLLGVTAGYLPFEKILLFSFYSMLIAAVISLVKLLRKKHLKERLSVCLSGPMLLSLLLFLGGVY